MRFFSCAAVVFSFEETTEAVDRFLSYSVTDRTSKTSRGGGEVEVEPEVQVVEEEEMEGNMRTFYPSFLVLVVRF